VVQHWTKRRWASLIVHVLFVTVPFTISTVSALLFWKAMFNSWGLAVPMVAVIEVLALIGLVLFILRIESPFTGLRHLLPFISIVPLGRELYLLLAHNDPWIAWSLTVLATLILVVISWQCFKTIERLFIDPIAAAREKAREQVATFTRTLAQLEEMNVIVDGFVRERLEYRKEVAVSVREPQGHATTPQALIEEDPLSEKKRVAARLRGDGRSWREIANTVGRSPSTVREWLVVPATNGLLEEES